jgi:16S rRNA processing protein RimM
MALSQSPEKDVSSSRFVELGRFGKSHALEGEVRFFCESSLITLLKVGALLYIKQKNEFLPIRILSVRQQPGQSKPGRSSELFFVKFDRIQNREEADRLRDHGLFVQNSPEITALLEEADSSDSVDYIGYVVMNGETPFGTVQEILETPAHPVFVVLSENREVLIPFTEPFIQSEDIENHVLFGYDLEQFLEI